MRSFFSLKKTTEKGRVIHENRVYALENQRFFAKPYFLYYTKIGFIFGVFGF
jgi:hypothetical protein